MIIKIEKEEIISIKICEKISFLGKISIFIPNPYFLRRIIGKITKFSTLLSFLLWFPLWVSLLFILCDIHKHIHDMKHLKTNSIKFSISNFFQKKFSTFNLNELNQKRPSRRSSHHLINRTSLSIQTLEDFSIRMFSSH